VEASHHDLGTAYISYTGMRRDDFGAYVYKTTDFGATWTDISANLPEEPVNVIREHHQNPNLLFLGTDFSLYVSVDGGQSWTKMKNNLPVNPVYDLKIHPRENDLIVATHGRGIYITDISPLAEVNLETLGQRAHFFQPESKIRWVAGLSNEAASDNFNGESEAAEIPFYYWLQSSAGGEVTFTVKQGNVTVATVTGPGSAGLNKVAWNMAKAPQGAAPPAAQGPGRFRRPDPAPLGEYTVVMSVNGQEVRRTVSILKDEWWMFRK
jgi:hypothetical protein